MGILFFFADLVLKIVAQCFGIYQYSPLSFYTLLNNHQPSGFLSLWCLHLFECSIGQPILLSQFIDILPLLKWLYHLNTAVLPRHESPKPQFGYLNTRVAIEQQLTKKFTLDCSLSFSEFILWLHKKHSLHEQSPSLNYLTKSNETSCICTQRLLLLLPEISRRWHHWLCFNAINSVTVGTDQSPATP